MGDKRAGKTATIKQRRVEIYLPSLETKDRWTAEAEQRGVSLSEMIFLLIHEKLTSEDPSTAERLTRLEKENRTLHAQLDAQRERVEALEAVKERQERDLSEYRAQAFLGGPIRKLDPRLLRVLSEAKDRSGRFRPVGETELKRALRVTPKDFTQSKALVAQLAFLETHQVVTHGQGGWTWNGQ